MGAATSLRGLALGGLGLFGASRATGLFRNLSPSFDKAFGQLTDEINAKLTIVAEKLVPLIEDLTAWISKTISGADIAAAMDFVVPKIRALGDLMASAVDAIRPMISYIKGFPAATRNFGAGIQSAVNSGVGMLPTGGPMSPLINAAGAQARTSFANAMARNEGASLRR